MNNTKFNKCETCGRYCEKTGGSDFNCDKDAMVIPIDAALGRNWREDLPTDEECEQNAYQEYTESRDWYLKNPNDPVAAWRFLRNHPTNRFGYGSMGYSKFKDNLYIEYVYINPETNRIDEDDAKNTKAEVWLEWGPYDEVEANSTHDTFCDVGADSFDVGICFLAGLIWRKYKDANYMVYAFAPTINAEWFEVDSWDIDKEKAVPGARIEVHNRNYHVDKNSNLIFDDPSEPMILLGTIVEVHGNKVRIEIEEKVMSNDRDNY